MQDHGMLGDIYSAAESDYDDVVERVIGTSSKPLDTLAIAEQAVKFASSMHKESGQHNYNFFSDILRLEVAICSLIDKCVASKEYPEGTKQLVGGIADKSMIRQYKLRQRLK
jgi:DNA-binding ferritin-like protein